ncbi:hexose kinase [Nocardia jejuensis]|uniref:hexose kinase n=1 Tax=Nocardia jejuensis TaxID=328049 RepID=UPI000AD0E5E5|nr:hexose kinase [Nocardia jejuensis]
MILTVTMNPAYDVTYRLNSFEHGVVQRVSVVEQRAGGKGINVCRVLNSLGIHSVATGFADLDFADEAEREMPVDFVHALPWIRRTLVISEADGTTTGLWEPGAALRGSAPVERLKTRIAALLPRASGVVISGSRPPGAGPDLPAELARAAVAAGLPVICDVDGDALPVAARVPGVIIMPNADELRALTGASPRTPADVVAAVRPLLAGGAGAVIATRGADGMVAVTAAGAWSACLPEPVVGNPTGAGDAAAAAVISGLAGVSKTPAAISNWPAVLADAVATSAAAVAMPLAGEIDHALRTRLARLVRVEPVRASQTRESP